MQMYNYGDDEINYQRFPLWAMLSFWFSYHKITLFEKKYVIKLITLISMYHLKLPLSLQVQLKLKSDVQIVSCTDTYRILFITALHREI